MAAIYIPNHMQQYLLKIRIAIVSVRAPPGSPQIHLHVTGTRRSAANLQYRAAKIRTAFKIRKSRMKYPNALTARRFQFAAPQTLMLPNRLYQPLRRELFVPQKSSIAEARTPLRVKILRRQNQATLLLEFCDRKVNTNRHRRKRFSQCKIERNEPQICLFNKTAFACRLFSVKLHAASVN